MSERQDILDELKPFLSVLRPGTADSNVNVAMHGVVVPQAVLMRAITEIERLRAEVAFLRRTAGAVTDGPSFDEITKSIRSPSAK